jgi:hypothetical protein
VVRWREKTGLKKGDVLDDTVLVFGNWSPLRQMRGKAPTMGKGLRRMMSKRFKKVYSIHEARTSKLCHGCYEVLDNVYDKNDKLIWDRKTCSNESCSESIHDWLQRDLNGAINIRYLSEELIENDTRPKAFASQYLDDLAKKKLCTKRSL